MLGIVPFALLLQLFAHAKASPAASIVFDAAHPTITQHAHLYQREVDASIVGYYYMTDDSGSTVVTSSEKPGSIAIFRGSTLVDWCSDDVDYLSKICPSEYWTSCSGATLYSAAGSTSCIGTCDYDIIYTGSTSDSNSLRWYHCMERSYLTFFREQPSGILIGDSSATESLMTQNPYDLSLGSSFSSTSASDPASPASSGTSTVVLQTFIPTNPPTPSADPSEGKGADKAWIAGVVIGAVGLFTVPGMGLYLWRHRRQESIYGYAPRAVQASPRYPPQQAAYYPPHQAPYESGPNPIVPSMLPNASAYDVRTYYGNFEKPAAAYVGRDVYPGNEVSQGVSAVQMPHKAAQVQPQAETHEFPELATLGR